MAPSTIIGIASFLMTVAGSAIVFIWKMSALATEIRLGNQTHAAAMEKLDDRLKALDQIGPLGTRVDLLAEFYAKLSSEVASQARDLVDVRERVSRVEASKVSRDNMPAQPRRGSRPDPREL